MVRVAAQTVQQGAACERKPDPPHFVPVLAATSKIYFKVVEKHPLRLHCLLLTFSRVGGVDGATRDGEGGQRNPAVSCL